MRRIDADGYPVYDLWECSACGYEIEGDIDDLTKYCPECGAKMSIDTSGTEDEDE